MVSVWAFLVHLLFVSTALAADFTEPVVSVLDGDTIEVLRNYHAERIRPNGIDCPEKGQAYGKRTEHAALQLVYGKEITLQTFGQDKYRVTIAHVLLPEGSNVNHTLVKDGWRWWYRKYAPGGCRARRLGEGSARGEERIVGRS